MRSGFRSNAFNIFCVSIYITAKWSYRISYVILFSVVCRWIGVEGRDGAKAIAATQTRWVYFSGFSATWSFCCLMSRIFLITHQQRVLQVPVISSPNEYIVDRHCHRLDVFSLGAGFSVALWSLLMLPWLSTAFLEYLFHGHHWKGRPKEPLPDDCGID